jgi:hypothetical protein
MLEKGKPNAEFIEADNADEGILRGTPKHNKPLPVDAGSLFEISA